MTQKSVLRRLLRLPLVVVLAAVSGLVLSSPASAVQTNSVTPVANCFWDNGNDTISVLFGYRNGLSVTQTEPVGTNNRFTVGAANRGQPTTFQPGTHNNVFVADIAYSELWASIDWQVAGRSVDISGVTECPSKPVPADGNTLAIVAFGLIVTAVGSYLLSGRRRRRGLPELA